MGFKTSTLSELISSQQQQQQGITNKAKLFSPAKSVQQQDFKQQFVITSTMKCSAAEPGVDSSNILQPRAVHSSQPNPIGSCSYV
jgi:hypothetical protein